MAYIIMNSKATKKYGIFNNLESAHKGRLDFILKNPSKNVLLYNTKTKTFLDWRKKEKESIQRRMPNWAKREYGY